MARTNPIKVQDILGGNYDTINCPSLKPFIESAGLILDRVIECATSKGITHTAGELAAMEMWVAAYLYTISDPIYASKTTANSSASYFERSYLDPAYMLDPSGCLKAIIKGTIASIEWLGKPPSAQLDYDQRN